MTYWLTLQERAGKWQKHKDYNFPPIYCLLLPFTSLTKIGNITMTPRIFWLLIGVGLEKKLRWPGSVGLSMIGECRWVLQCFPYRHWISSPPLKAAATASPGTSCTEPQFSRQVTIVVRGGTRWGNFGSLIYQDWTRAPPNPVLVINIHQYLCWSS